jgi:hypothetical protein
MVYMILIESVFLMEKKDMIAEIKERANAVIIKEFNPDGAMIEYNSSGVVKGKYHANHLETADVKMKMDGTHEWEIRAMEMTKEGDVVMITGKGTGQQNNFTGEFTYMTNSPRLSWLNNTKARVEGTTDMKSNEATLKVWPEKQATVPAPETPAPEKQETVPPAAPTQTPAPTM